jgi:hypothetical protein
MAKMFQYNVGTDHSEDLGVDGWEEVIRIDLREIGWEVVDWMLLAQDGDQ